MKIKLFIASLKLERVSKKSIFLMKLSLSVYLICCFQLAAFHSFSQKKVTLTLKNASLEQIVDHIENQTSFNFIYNNDDINIYQKFDINIENEPIEKALKKLFGGSSINYSVKNEHVILSKLNREQQKYTISGIVKDGATGETLLGANILIKNESTGTTTNEYGFYSITLRGGDYTLLVSYIGFDTKEIPINLNGNIKMDFELAPISNSLEEVVIQTESNNKSQVGNVLTGVSNIKTAEIKKMPAFFGEPDVTRVLLTQSGVSTVGEGATGFNVRGGNIDQNLILLDEAPLYNSSHLWGLFSVINSDAVKDLKFYKGGTPARFGGRASSVLEIRQKEGNSKEFKGEGGLGLLFSRLTLEGPIKKDKINFLVSGRRTYFDLFFPLFNGEIKDNRLFFYDLNTKLTFDINENNKLFVSGYFGSDVMKLKFEDTTIDNEGNEVQETDEEIDFRWKNATATVRWNHLFSDKLFMNLSGIYSNYNYSLSSKNDSGGGPAGTSGSFDWVSSVENWILKPDFTYYLNPETKMRFGVNNTLYRFTPAKIKNTEPGINNIDFDVERGLEIAPYYEIEKKWEKFEVNLGLRYSWFGNMGPYEVSNYDPNFPRTPSTILSTTKYKKGEVIKSYSGFEPRVSLKYNLSDNSAVKLGYNRMFQYIHLITNTNAALPFDVWKPSGAHVKPLEVNQISAGFASDSKNKKYNFSLEGYYKTFNNIVEYVNGANLFVNRNIETELLTAKGYSYGAEFAVHKNRGKLTGNLNYTYSVSRRKTTSPFQTENINGGDYFPSNFDRPHILNITTNYKLSKKWSLGAFFTYQTGRPTTIATGRIDVGGDQLLTYSDRNAYRIGDTHRLDISFTYKPKGNPNTKWEGSWNFGIYNAYGRKNPFSTYYSFNQGILKNHQFSLIGAPIPFVTYNFKF